MLNNIRVNNEIVLLNNVARVVMSQSGRATLYGIDGQAVTYFDGEAGGVVWAFLSETCTFSTDAPETTFPAPLPVDDGMSITFAADDDKFEIAGWEEPTPEEVAHFWSDENADERADVIREAHYGKQL